MKKQTKQFRIYKPTRSNNGAASSIDFRREEKEYGKLLVFWVSTVQTGTDKDGNAQFAWKDKNKTVTLLLGTPDMAEILAVLKGIKQYAGLKGTGPKPTIFHKNEKGNKSFMFGRLPDNSGYEFRLSSKEGANPVVAVSHRISLEEGVVLEILFSKILEEMYT